MRVRHSSRAMPGSVADSESPAPVTILLSPRARVLLLAVIARGDDGFIITSRKGDVAVRARLVRTATIDIDYGCLSIDWCSGTVSSSIGRVMLSRTELRLLGALLASGERAVAYEQLLECTWPGAGSDGSPGLARMHQLQAYMYSLRNRLTRLGASARLETVAGAGYILRP